MAVSLTVQARPYLELAEKLVDGRITEDQLPHLTPRLPPLDRGLLDYLANHSDQVSLRLPKYSWAVTAVADAAAAHLPDAVFLQALAAWYVARAANAWTRPQRVEEAISRARAGFTTLGETGWTAASDWQLNALPWIRPNLEQARAELEAALATIEAAGSELSSLSPQCRLALASVQVLAGDFSTAAANINQCDVSFTAHNDQRHLAHCLVVKSGYLRRQSHLDEAMVCIEKASAIFHQESALAGVAWATFQLGFIQWLLKADYPAAEVSFNQAFKQFEALDLPLQSGLCRDGLSQIYIMSGRLTEADTSQRQARHIFDQYRIPGLQSNALLNSGWLEMQRGNYRVSLEYLTRAEGICQRIGNDWQYAAILMHLGEVYVQLSRYQQALHHLEKAHEKFETLGSLGRMAECELRLARSWLQLSRPEKSLYYLNSAEEHARQANHPGILPYLHYRRAAALFYLGKEIEGIAALQEGLAAAESQEDRTGTALCQRLTGDALRLANQPEEALIILRAAETGFADMGMVVEQAACQVALGHCYALLGERDSARAAWEKALVASLDVMPDIAWQTYAGLAQLAEEVGDDQTALQLYQLMVQTLIRLRQGLWQPTLIDSFLNRPGRSLDRAVAFAARLASGFHLLGFIEAGKASTAARQFQGDHQFQLTGVSSEALTNLAVKIRWLQNKIRADFQDKRGWLRPPEEWQLRQQLAQKVKEHDALKDQLERAAFPTQPLSGAAFDLAQFRHIAQVKLGSNWAALDYYLSDDQLHGVLLTPEDCTVWSAKASGSARAALRLLSRSGPASRDLTARDRQALGRWLLPELVQGVLTAVTILIIAPHRQLHHLPWAALSLAAGQPLVTACVPVIVPSLNSLALLWQRPSPRPPASTAGLLLAVSDFQGRYPDLPQVRVEADALAVHLGSGGQQLRETEVTRSNLYRLREEEGLSRFSYLHIASHAFHDPVSGRLSSLALVDHDLWLDELWEYAPLPPLVTLSACSGIQSLVYEGDEHVGLAPTCLAAGAQSVVGSLWPVKDAGLPQFILAFYDHLFSGHGPAQSLTLAQRAAWRQGNDVAQWGSFLCIGQP